MGKKFKVLSICLIGLLLMNACSEEDLLIVTEENSIVQSPIEASIVDDIFNLVNDHRKRMEMPSLKRSDIADNLAKEHSIYMIDQNEISHDGFNSRFQELQQNANASSAGENVASGYQNAESVMQAWLASSGHKANIEGDYTHIGLAAVENDQGTFYYTQIFYK